MKRQAFLTGSRAYGTPREDSDYDVVVFAEESLQKLLLTLSDKPDQTVFGKLNLILCERESQFDAWLEGTEKLIAKKPVTREEAVRVLKAEGVEEYDLDDKSPVATTEALIDFKNKTEEDVMKDLDFLDRPKPKEEKPEMSGALQAIVKIREKEGKNVKVSGSIPCPLCGKDLHYSIASNGHIHARCEGRDVMFMM